MKQFAILLNGEVLFYLNAKSQWNAVHRAQSDPRYTAHLRSRPTESIAMTAKENSNNAFEPD